MPMTLQEQAQEAVSQIADRRGDMRDRFDRLAATVRTLEARWTEADARGDEHECQRLDGERQAAKDRVRLTRGTLDLLDQQFATAEAALTEEQKRTSAETKARTQREAEPALDAWHVEFCDWIEEKRPAMLNVAALIDRAVRAEREDAVLHGRFLSGHPEVYDVLGRVGEGRAFHRLFVMLELMRNGVLAVAVEAAAGHSRNGEPRGAGWARLSGENR